MAFNFLYPALLCIFSASIYIGNLWPFVATILIVVCSFHLEDYWDRKDKIIDDELRDEINKIKSEVTALKFNKDLK